MQKTFTCQITTSIGFLNVCATEAGILLAVDVAKNQIDENQDAQNKSYGENKKVCALFALVKNQFAEYFSGNRKIFDVPIIIDALAGTAFQKSVWAALLGIPYGKTLSYADIARAIHNERAVRAVGGAIGKNPLLVLIPCHRVIGKNGSLTGFSAGINRKIALLTLEKSMPLPLSSTAI